MDWQERSRRLAGSGKIDALGKAHVLLFGLGGVGSFAAEALVRSGLGRLSLVEYDRVTDSNRNRQLPALTSTVGRRKIEVCARRLLDIHPKLELHLYPFRMTGENLPDILDGQGGRPDFIADAIDDLPAKVRLIAAAKERGIPSISALGAGYRLDPSQLLTGDISETHTCPLARRLRRGLREEGITQGVPVIWSKESPAEKENPAEAVENRFGEARCEDSPDQIRRRAPASMIFVPAAAGLLMASYIVKHIA